MNVLPKKSHWIASIWTRSLIAGVGLILAAWLGMSLWQANATNASAEPYTELYFNRNLTLPTAIEDEPITFSFTIRNAEGRTMHYPYLVIQKRSDGTTITLKAGSVDLADTASTKLPLTFTLARSTSPSEILVLLPNQQQEIHFWLGTTQ